MIHVYRRKPTHCLYCDQAAVSDEHVVPCAIGGRLTAPILCHLHNNAASAADNALSTWFAPWTNMLAIPRQDGKIGTSFSAKSIDGRDVLMTSDGRVEEPNRVTERDSQGRILRAIGDLKWLDRLRKQSSAAFSTQMPAIALPSTPPVVDLKLGLTDEAWPGIVKMALHLVAGFVDHVVISDQLRMIVLENRPPPVADYVRSVPWDLELFGEESPPRHEITAYPGRDATFVTLMLFGVFALSVKLPGVSVMQPVRYSQTLDGAAPVLTVVAPARCRWDPPMDDTEVAEFLEGLHRRMNAVYDIFKLREHEDMCIAAARNAVERTKTMSISFIDAFRAELQLYSWPADLVEDAVAQTKIMLTSRLYPWEFPFTRDRGPGWTRQSFLDSKAS